MPDGTIVNNRDHIGEFYANVENKLVRQIQDQLAKYNEQFQLQPQHVQCNECTQEYIVPLNFDYANFFGKGF